MCGTCGLNRWGLRNAAPTWAGEPCVAYLWFNFKQVGPSLAPILGRTIWELYLRFRSVTSKYGSPLAMLVMRESVVQASEAEGGVSRTRPFVSLTTCDLSYTKFEVTRVAIKTTDSWSRVYSERSGIFLPIWIGFGYSHFIIRTFHRNKPSWHRQQFTPEPSRLITVCNAWIITRGSIPHRLHYMSYQP